MLVGLSTGGILVGGLGSEGADWDIGGETFGVREDTDRVRGETVGVRGDTAGVRGDTVGVRGDTVRVPEETFRVCRESKSNASMASHVGLRFLRGFEFMLVLKDGEE